MRLHAYIARAGVCSRRAAERLVAEGRVSVNGRVTTKLSSTVVNGDRVCCDGKQVKLLELCYVLLNKPTNCITTRTDPEGRRTVIQLLPRRYRGHLYPVGRLDRNTTGLLLLTNDGELAHRLAHPRFMVDKRYLVSLGRSLAKRDKRRLLLGVKLEDGMAKVDAVTDGVVADSVCVTLHSGKNRIVRRLFAHLGYRVMGLHREGYGSLELKGLGLGKYHVLEGKELAVLKRSFKDCGIVAKKCSYVT
jgi:23S rRNA pseudouridine2605 synthase